MKFGNAGKREVDRWADNRAENSHQPFRRRERAMLRFARMKTLQQFASVHNQFNHERHLVSRDLFSSNEVFAPVFAAACCRSVSWRVWTVRFPDSRERQ